MTGLKPQIRWPNDIVVDNRKVAGILCEQRKEAIVIGKPASAFFRMVLSSLAADAAHRWLNPRLREQG